MEVLQNIKNEHYRFLNFSFLKAKMTQQKGKAERRPASKVSVQINMVKLNK
jgi:hypothetical protein